MLKLNIYVLWVQRTIDHSKYKISYILKNKVKKNWQKIVVFSEIKSNRLLNRVEKEKSIFNKVKGSIIHKSLIDCSYHAIKAKQSFELGKDAQEEDRKYLPPYSDDKPSAFHFSPFAAFSLFDGRSLELLSDFYDRKSIRIHWRPRIILSGGPSDSVFRSPRFFKFLHWHFPSFSISLPWPCLRVGKHSRNEDTGMKILW